VEAVNWTPADFHLGNLVWTNGNADLIRASQWNEG
jgi:hypothetical protein